MRDLRFTIVTGIIRIIPIINKVSLPLIFSHQCRQTMRIYQAETRDASVYAIWVIW